MRSSPPPRYAALLALGCALWTPSRAHGITVQEENSATAVLLSRARTLEQRGRLDLAKQDWAQVLLVDPNEAEALAGLVRAARSEGKAAEASQYLSRLKAAHPRDPEVARLEGAGGSRESNAELTEAARLAHAGNPREAMALYRRVYGLNPPAGAPALAYYETEAATDEGRPHAIAGLRALADRFPADARYPIALGRVLLSSPRTRAEGRTLLEQYPGNADAVAALKGTASGEEHAAAGASATAKPSPAVPLPRAEVAQKTPESNGSGASGRAQAPSAQTAEVHKPLPPVRVDETPRASAGQATVRQASASAPRHGGFAAEEQAGFNALNQHRAAEAEQRFREILSKDPTNPRALAGLGYLRTTQGDLKSAVRFFEQAQENGDRSLALTRALVNAQFDYALQSAAVARGHGDLPGAEAQYRAALRERPSDPAALGGLGETLLQGRQLEEAIPVFQKLAQVRPMDPAAWRGLVISQANSGRGPGALATDAKIPAEAKTPLLTDAGYRDALARAHGEGGTQVARAEAPPPLPPARTVAPPPTPPPSRTVAPSTSPAAPPPSPARTPAPAASAPPPGQPARPPANAAATPTAPGVPFTSSPAIPGARSTVSPTPPATPKNPAPPASVPPAAAGNGTATKPGRTSREGTAPAGSGGAVPLGTRSATRARNGANAAPTPPPATQPAPAPPVTAPAAAPAGAEAIARERTSQGDAALARGEFARAAGLFHDALGHDPERPEALKGLVLSLEQGGHPEEALAAWDRTPPNARGVLERDATFQYQIGTTLLHVERPNDALHAFARAQDVFASQKLPPPLELLMRIADLLAARGDDANLYRELMYLGERRDLSDAQRREVQMIWTGWAVRRARTLSMNGDHRRAVMVLNAAAEAFAGNPKVLGAVANGYAGAGLPREAVALYRAQDLGNVPIRDLETAIGAAIAAREYRVAEGWVKLGRQRFPSDPEMLTVAAELEQARGRQSKAVELSQQAKALAPAQNPAEVLTAELREAQAGQGWRPGRPGQLGVLLAPADAVTLASPGTNARPFLPSAAENAALSSSIAQAPVLPVYDEPSR